MRKILLATTALVALTGAAQAAESPITVNVGGYVDFRAALFHESDASVDSATKRAGGDFETEYRLNIDAKGKGSHGIEYGAKISLWNGSDYTNSWNNDSATTANRGTTLHESQAYVWMSGAWGKALFGDTHGASDLFVYAPTVGEGQFDGTYTDFTDPTKLTAFLGSYVDNTENNTKIVYYTPKVGNANHKVQAGVSYAPNYSDEGQNVVKYNTTGTAYKDSTKIAAQYTGNFNPVSVVFSAKTDMARKNDRLDVNSSIAGVQNFRDYATWGLGTQLTYAGFTLGGSYVDAGHAYTVQGQNKTQSTWTAGLKYEFDKVAVAANYLNGRGYNNAFTTMGTDDDAKVVDYVKNFNAYGLGATYTWFPGLTTAADAMLFQQKRADHTALSAKDDGYVLMLSQKMAF
jgi:hypothetical protein